MDNENQRQPMSQQDPNAIITALKARLFDTQEQLNQSGELIQAIVNASGFKDGSAEQLLGYIADLAQKAKQQEQEEEQDDNNVDNNTPAPPK
ncbi:hypothetical protein JYB87_11785 [Shewanella avicenniae]|uniref:Uncharacterized protein n=1 Tax=Shewanella avicenniae TaxID=2814294 RepID=A0ABX7QLW8_9GAMM|nr:hypothetical protein [Shewanella avicenniae]QSX32447.1 hypothetical protein JYB87_11785 [Shewanella avicenniae]